MRITTTRLHALQHLKVVIGRLKAIERQGTLTSREREVLREHLERAYDRAAALLPPDLLHTEEAQGKGGTSHAAH